MMQKYVPWHQDMFDRLSQSLTGTDSQNNVLVVMWRKSLDLSNVILEKGK